MGFTDNDIRASHTIRIFGTNSDDEVLQDIWLDIERVDVIRISTQILGHWQGMYRRLYWLDDPAGNDYAEHGNPARAEGVKKICSPDEEDQEDPAEWVPVRTIIEMSWNESTDHQQLKARRGNRTDGENLVRLVEARRCFNRDTSIDADVEAATAGDSGLKAYVVASNEYSFDEGSEDNDQYIEVQYVSCTMDLSSNKEDEGKNQGVQFSMKNVHYLNFTDEAEGPANENHGFDPPWALDPFQAIVNVQWSPVQEAVLGTEAFPISYTDTITETSADGLEWQDGFGTSSNAASGLGHTVVCSGRKFIAFGKPRDGAACFIAAKGYEIERGVLNDAGELVWGSVASLPEGDDPVSYGVQSCSFAGGGFFVSYLKDADALEHSYLAISFDGTAFTLGIKPFNGVAAAAGAGSPSPVGGNVAYDKENEVYVTTGYFDHHYDGQYSSDDGEFSTGFFEENFMSSKSGNGTSWTPKFDSSEGSGIHSSINATTDIGGGVGSSASTTCFGNGKFWAASRYKMRVIEVIPPGTTYTYLSRGPAGLASSVDGVSWTNQRLPGSISSGPDMGLDNGTGGWGNCVRFFKGKKNASGVKGFFVATAREYLADHSLQSKLYQSMDGNAWTLVRTDTASDWILSAINKSRGTVVNHE